MEETSRVIDMLDGGLPDSAPARDTGPARENAKEARTAKSMQNLTQLTALFQGTWQPPA